MAAPPQARSWEDLPAVCLHEIFCRVPDRHRASRACPAWFEELNDSRTPTVPPALPWLLLPAPNPNGSARVACVLRDCRVHQDHRYLTVIPRGARCFGSHDGAWLFLAIRDPHGHQLLNVRTGEVQRLPNMMVMPDDQYQPWPIFIQAAAISSSTEDGNYFAVYVVKAAAPPAYRYVTMWLKGWPFAIQIGPPDRFFNTEDLIYHESAFHLLHGHGNEVTIYLPQVLPDRRLIEGFENRRFHPGGRIYEELVRSRYLVSSRGELLLVERFRPEPDRDEPTSMFKVFRATKRPQMPDDDADFPVAEFPWAWSELDTLDGRILFVGHGCSRAYEVDDYKDFKIKAAIFFFDDTVSPHEVMRRAPSSVAIT